jgi:hypothetical protein
MNDDVLPIADNVIPEVRRIEEQPGLLGEINRHVADGNAWTRYARARYAKANVAITKLNVERAKAIPPLPAIPPVPLPKPIAFVELPPDPEPDPGSEPSPTDSGPSPALPIEQPQSGADIKAAIKGFMEGGKGKNTKAATKGGDR